jgi:ketosteroid isomerase-like protein
MFKGPLEDRIAIRELHETYADAVVRADADDWSKVWTENARWTLMGATVEGREAIVGLWKQAMSGLEAVSFHCIPSMISIAGARATGRCQTQEYMKVKDGTTRAIGGLYEDTMIKEAGQWRYSERVFRIVAEYQPKEA